VNRTKLGINIQQRNPELNPLNLIPDMTFSSIQNLRQSDDERRHAVLQPEHYLQHSSTRE